MITILVNGIQNQAWSKVATLFRNLCKLLIKL
jgi:hypothetical protein